jgi:endonuclease/exonuclease/phosphatase family metal-dependent hydrolase
MTPLRILPILVLAFPTTLLAVSTWRQTQPALLDLGVPAELPRPVAPSEAPIPEGRLRVLSLNAAHGRSVTFHQALLDRDEIRANLTAVGNVLMREAADIVALQEIDGPSVWSGHFDQVRSLAQFAGYGHMWRGSHATGFGPVELDYGTALISRLPLWGAESRRFDASWRDNKGFVVATVEVPGFGGLEVDVASVHLDFMRAAVRADQIQSLIDTLRERSGPLVIVGDFNCTWQEPTCLPVLSRELGVRPHAPGQEAPTFPSDDPGRRIDWILISDTLEFDGYATLNDEISDHRAIVANLRMR